MSDASPDEWLTAEAVAAVLGVSKRQAQRLCDEGDIRAQRERRPFLYHSGDVQLLAEQRASAAQRVNDATSHAMSRPNEWQLRYDQERAKTEQAAHTIGQLEERVRQLEAQRDARPLLEDHAAIRAERDALAAEVERLRAERDTTYDILRRRVMSDTDETRDTTLMQRVAMPAEPEQTRPWWRRWFNS